MTRARAACSAALACLLLVMSSGVVPVGAQITLPPAERILLTAGRSTVLNTAYDITRIAITDPTIADAVAVQPREVLIDGKKAGTISLIIWGAGGERTHYDIVVDAGVSQLQQELQQLFPGEDVRASITDEAIILSGSVSNNLVKLRAAEVATGTSSKLRVINLLQLPQGTDVQQVMLQVRVAEVNRRAVEELGLNFFLTRGNNLGRVTTGQFPAPVFDEGGGGGGAGGSIADLVFGDFLNLFYFNREEGLGAALKALQQKGYYQSLAEPNLIAYNGQEASFLAGGEFPVPVVQGVTNAVTIEWKEFGVRLNFRPTIAGDTIRLKVRPEVSALDFNNGITLQGFRVPSLITRRAETDIELRDGQSFAIAGLLNNIAQTDGSAIPFLSAIPIIGTLFKSKADRKEQTELLVLVTPRLVRPLNPDEVPSLPTMPGQFLVPPNVQPAPVGEPPPPPAPRPDGTGAGAAMR